MSTRAINVPIAITVVPVGRSMCQPNTSTPFSAAERKAVAEFFSGKSPLYKGKIAIAADKIVCRTSDVDVTSRSCELTYGDKTRSLTGREANEVYATEAMAGVPSEGAAGSIYEGLSKLTCTLDPEAIKGVLEVMVGLARDGMTMLVVTHEMGFARTAADRVLFMADGAIVEEAPPEEFFARPRSRRAQDFLATIL